MKNLTPMKRLQPHFKKMSALLPPFIRVLALNHAEPRYRGGSYWMRVELGDYTKGVKADHRRIFFNKEDNNLSVSFAFSYIGCEPNVVATIKSGVGDNELYLNSKAFSHDEFRLLMNKFNAYLTNHRVKKFDDFLGAFEANFILDENELSVAYDLKQCKKEYKDLIGGIKESIDEKERLKNILTRRKLVAENDVAIVVNNSDENKALQTLLLQKKELDRQIKETKQSVLELERKASDELKLTEVNESLSICEKEKAELIESLPLSKRQYLKRFPLMVIKKIDPDFTN